MGEVMRAEDMVAQWVMEFRKHEETPWGVAILFVCYEDTDDGENQDIEFYDVFIHKDSLELDSFPEHEEGGEAGIVERPEEEVRICVTVEGCLGDAPQVDKSELADSISNRTDLCTKIKDLKDFIRQVHQRSFDP